MNRRQVFWGAATAAVLTYGGVMAVQADQELRRNESDRRELDFQSYVESEWDGPAIVTEIRVEGDQRAWGEVAFSDRTCEFEYGIDQRDYGRYDRADFEVRCK